MFLSQSAQQGAVSGQLVEGREQRGGLHHAKPVESSLRTEDRATGGIAGSEWRRVATVTPRHGRRHRPLGCRGRCVAKGLVLGEPLAGLASLELDIPERGIAYYFTTPGKKVTITARPMKHEIVKRAVNFAWLFGIAVGLCIIFVVTRRLAQSRRGLVMGAVVLELAGLTMLLMGVLPLFGLILILGGILVVVEAFNRRTACNV